MTKLANGVCKLLLVTVSYMGANNTITTASSLSSGVPRCPTSFFKLEILVLQSSYGKVYLKKAEIELVVVGPVFCLTNEHTLHYTM